MKKNGPPSKSQQTGFPQNRPPAQLPASVMARLQQAVALHQQGKLTQAKLLYQQVLTAAPTQPDALHFLGVLEAQQGNPTAATDLIERAVKLAPGNSGFHGDLAKAFLAANRPADALASCDHAIRLRPDFAEAIFNKGVALLALGRPAEALANFDRTLQFQGQNASVFYNHGYALLQLGKIEESLKSFERALVLRPRDADLLYNQGTALLNLDRFDDALQSFDRTLEIRPEYAEAHNNRGTALRKLNRTEEAIGSYDHALRLKPNHLGALINRGTAFSDLDRKAEALACYDRALQVAPGTPEALLNRGTTLRDLNRYSESLKAFSALLQIAPDYEYALGHKFFAQLQCCDWSDYTKLTARLSAAVTQGKRYTLPFAFLAQSASPAEQLRCAEIYVADKWPASARPVWAGQRYQHEKIRIAYLSADFHNHATAYLMAGLFTLHDRSKFEISAISFGPDGAGGMRERLKRSFDRFIDVRRMSDRQVAELLRMHEIDIAVDLKGFTADSRPGILAQRAAPVQVSYIGYPGTLGADYIDYIIADHHVIPVEDETFYTEKIARLPEAYQVTDDKRAWPRQAPTRAEVGLPETGFIFCCFNNSYKLSPEIFAIWMRLLQRVDGSVLWLLDDNPDATRHLREAAERHDIARTRLVFAPRVRPEEHLARHRLADLFLDTQPYTAHTTASDALWMGLPLVTCMGSSFASRVAGSLLHAMGLPELIAGNLQAYESLAADLATTPALLTRIKDKLDRCRTESPLFDTDRFRRHLEAAYITMWQRSRKGEVPVGFSVAPIDG